MLNSHQIQQVESKVILLKIVSGVAACIILLFSGINLGRTLAYYMQTLASFYLMLFSTVIILSEFSPYIFEKFILKTFPFLQFHSGRGIFYLIMGTFCLDGEMGFYVKVGGLMLISTGILYVAAFFLIDWEKTKVQHSQRIVSNHA